MSEVGKKADKSESDARQQKQNSGSHYRVLHILFLYNWDKEFRITRANAPKKFQLLDRRGRIKIIGK